MNALFPPMSGSGGKTRKSNGVFSKVASPFRELLKAATKVSKTGLNTVYEVPATVVKGAKNTVSKSVGRLSSGVNKAVNETASGVNSSIRAVFKGRKSRKNSRNAARKNSRKNSRKASRKASRKNSRKNSRK